MRQELEQVLLDTINGDEGAAMLLHAILEGCLDLQPLTDDAWKDHPAERTWPEYSVQRVMPQLGFLFYRRPLN